MCNPIPRPGGIGYVVVKSRCVRDKESTDCVLFSWKAMELHSVSKICCRVGHSEDQISAEAQDIVRCKV
ncbi:hypothetical protein Tco_0167731 [Tanacetum coccineum]